MCKPTTRKSKGATDATPRAFVDLAKAFDYVNREALFTTFKKVGCPPILLDLTKSFHENLQGTAQVYGMISDHNPFPL